MTAFYFKEYPVAVSPMVGGQKAVNCWSLISKLSVPFTDAEPSTSAFEGLPFDTSTLGIRFQHERAV